MATTTAHRAPPGMALGGWSPVSPPVPASDADACRGVLGRVHDTIAVVQTPQGLALCAGGTGHLGAAANGVALPLRAVAPPVPLTALGDRSFCDDHGVRVAYATGSMANGIASVEIVQAIARAGMLGFFGAAGLPLPLIEASIERLHMSLGDTPFGVNLIHSPNEPDHERDTVRLFLQRGVRLIEASAFLDLTPALVHYRLSGLRRGADGRVVAPNRVVGKVSRIEVATKFLSPAPERFVRELLEAGKITSEEAELSRLIPVAQDVTAEADSGGHTDNRPAVTLLPTLIALRDRLQARFAGMPLRIGAAGGIATPLSAAAAFAMGAAYVVTGSVNQACLESGSSDAVRRMLAQAEQADVTMAPAADMFEMGVKVQVLKRGTMFAMRGAKLYELYRAHSGLDALPAAERATLEKQVFRAPLEEIWRQTREYFQRRDPSQVERAERDPKHLMALVFRWYLGQASRWANAGVADRALDYQVWCGPAMGAFNEWTRGTFLESPSERRVVPVAWNLMYGAAVCLRATGLRVQGVDLSPDHYPTRPTPLAELAAVAPEVNG